MLHRSIAPLLTGLLVLPLLFAPAPALAISLTLHDLVVGAVEFDSGDALLHFSGFEATPGGDAASGDLADYEVEILDDGFRIVAGDDALWAEDGDVGSLDVHYVVSAAPGHVIDGAGLSAVAAAMGESGFAGVSESFMGPGGGMLGELGVAVPGGPLSDSTGLAPRRQLLVWKGIELRAMLPGDQAHIESIDQSYSASVPEPAAPSLLGLALALGALRRGLRVSRP